MIGRLRMLGAAAVVAVAILAGLWWVSPRVEAQAPPPGRVGFVDLQRILAKSQAGVLAREQLERKVRDVRRLVDDLEKELQKKEQGLLAKVLRDVEGVVAKIGKERGYLMIVERRQGGLIFGAPEADVTEEIIKAFDDEMRKAKK